MKTKAMAEGALFCALAVLFALMCYYVPFLILLYIFIPVPIVVLAQKQGFKVAVISSVSATIILFFLIDPLTAVVFGMYLTLVGCSLGYVYYKEKSGIIKISVGYVSAFLVIILGILLFQVISGQNYIESMIGMIDTAAGDALKLYETTGMLSGDQLSQLGTTMEGMINNLKMNIPAVFLMLPFFMGWVNVVISDLILKRLGMKSVPLKSLSQWRLPKSLKMFLIVLILGLLFIELMKVESIPAIYMFTLSSIVSMIYFIMGLSFAFWWINRKRDREKSGLKVLICALCVLIPFFMTVITILGTMDIYIDLRAMSKDKGGSQL